MLIPCQLLLCTPKYSCTEAERDLVAANAWARARHAERSCSAWRGMQTATHDQVSKLFQALLADAGWDDINGRRLFRNFGLGPQNSIRNRFGANVRVQRF